MVNVACDGCRQRDHGEAGAVTHLSQKHRVGSGTVTAVLFVLTTAGRTSAEYTTKQNSFQQD